MKAKKTLNIYDEECKHCQHNPNVEKPLAEMKHIHLTDLTVQLLEEAEKETGINQNCILCLACKAMMTIEGKSITDLIKALQKEKEEST